MQQASRNWEVQQVLVHSKWSPALVPSDILEVGVLRAPALPAMVQRAPMGPVQVQRALSDLGPVAVQHEAPDCVTAACKKVGHLELQISILPSLDPATLAVVTQ